MDNMEFVVRVYMFGGENAVPPCYVAQLGWIMAYPDAMYGFNEDTIVVLFSAYFEALLCSPAIIAVDIPYGKFLGTSGIMKLRI